MMFLKIWEKINKFSFPKKLQCCVGGGFSTKAVETVNIKIGARAIFCQVGGGKGRKPDAQKLGASCPNFYETVKKKRGA